MEEGSSSSLKRKRNASTHRWVLCQTAELLQLVLEEVKDCPEKFEKPTANRFYEKISSRSLQINELNWNVMKNKMRYLKSQYMAAVSWKSNTGAGLLAEGNEKSVHGKKVKYAAQSSRLSGGVDQRFVKYHSSFCATRITLGVSYNRSQKVMEAYRSSSFKMTATSTICHDCEWKRNLNALELFSGVHQCIVLYFKQPIIIEYITKICPHWDVLDEIFGHRKNTHPSIVVDSAECSYEGFVDNFAVCEVQYLDEYDTENLRDVEVDLTKQNDETNVAASGINVLSFKSGPKKQITKKKLTSSDSNSLSVLISMQETKNDQNMQRIELEKERLKLMASEIELKKTNQQQNEEIKRLEIESSEKVALAKINMEKEKDERSERVALCKLTMQMEKDERIAKYELELKYKQKT